MYRRGLLTAAVALSLGLGLSGLTVHPANAADTNYTEADLGDALTPTGAIRAGNADGSIPAWTGGVTTPPAGYSPGDHHIAPLILNQRILSSTMMTTFGFLILE